MIENYWTNELTILDNNSKKVFEGSRTFYKKKQALEQIENISLWKKHWKNKL